MMTVDQLEALMVSKENKRLIFKEAEKIYKVGNTNAARWYPKS